MFSHSGWPYNWVKYDSEPLGLTLIQLSHNDTGRIANQIEGKDRISSGELDVESFEMKELYDRSEVADYY